MIQQLVESAAIKADLAAKTKEAALKELLEVALAAGMLPKKAATTFGKRLAEREAIGSTGLGNGVAVPHVKGEDLTQTSLVLGRIKNGIEWQAIDGRPVQIVFLLLAPANEPENHLRCLRWISTLARSADFRRFLLDTKDADGMRDLMREMIPKE